MARLAFVGLGAMGSRLARRLLAAGHHVSGWNRTPDKARELAKRGVTFPPSQANFLLVKVADAGALRERLLRAGLVVRDGAAVGFPGHLRISIGTRETNERLLRVFDEA